MKMESDTQGGRGVEREGERCHATSASATLANRLASVGHDARHPWAGGGGQPAAPRWRERPGARGGDDEWGLGRRRRASGVAIARRRRCG